MLPGGTSIESESSIDVRRTSHDISRRRICSNRHPTQFLQHAVNGVTNQ